MELTFEPATKDHRFWKRADELNQEAFPPEEYMDACELLAMAKAEDFDFWIISDPSQEYSQGSFVGFAAVMTFEDLAYLLFLAIDPGSRSKGYGGRALQDLSALYPGKTFVLDFERLDDAAPNAGQRRRRKAFYLRNGYAETGLFLSYAGVEYEVVCKGSFAFESFKDLMQEIQIDGFELEYR